MGSKLSYEDGSITEGKKCTLSKFVVQVMEYRESLHSHIALSFLYGRGSSSIIMVIPVQRAFPQDPIQRW